MSKNAHYCLVILFAFMLIFYGIASVEASPVVTNHYANKGCTDITRTLLYTDPPMTGEDILELQQRLVELKYNSPQNGIYDKRTAEIIRKFKTANNLSPTTEVGPLTWAQLGKDASTSPSSTNQSLGKPEHPVQMLIEVTKQRLTVFSKGKPFHSFPIAVGKQETPTPHGEFKIVSKGAWGGGFGTRWNGLNVPWGIFGIHGTNKPWSIGRYASHGCIRMLNRDVETLFPWVAIGTPVKIVNSNLKPPNKISRTFKPKSSGQLIVFVQEALKKQRFLAGLADGIYGTSTTIAVSYFQAFNNLPITGEVDPKTYDLIMAKGQ
ncbi:peptidoglycan-binding protein [Metallumcola ferriviriculae]|uniref:Peptidoglycan-binding protein n=1 Tax=Metallumcola ferriviriculae TaxID=3039180 RepID=A0AAU0UJP5_9FIRM|nr:peptidoglycan-binding protein [Desulfitibacteraceae bacterium MK1]